MDGIIGGNYREFKQELDQEIHAAAAGFVKIGYLLKVARDTDVLAESGYSSVADFAKAEYGLTKDIVSRYIAINDRYSENGYSEQLREEYRAYGVAKLAEMLTLPEEIAEQIPPQMTKKEIQDIKHDYREEQQVSDLEVLMEERQAAEFDNNLERMLYEYFREPSVFRTFFTAYQDVLAETGGDIEEAFSSTDRMLDVLAPTGIANLRARIPGIGRMMLVINGEDEDVMLTNMRSMEKEAYQWPAVGGAMEALYQPQVQRWEDAYRMLYGEDAVEENAGEKAEVAPVQPKSVPEEVESAPKELAGVPKEPGSVPKELESVPDNLGNASKGPEDIAEEKVGEKTEVAPVQPEDVSEEGRQQEDMPEENGQQETSVETEVKEAVPEKAEAEVIKNTYNKEMLRCARNSLRNLNVEIEHKAYRAALASARHLVHYLEAAGVDEDA